MNKLTWKPKPKQKASFKKAAFERFQGICWLCNRFCALEDGSIDHFHPLSTHWHLRNTRFNHYWAHIYCNSLRGLFENNDMSFSVNSAEKFTALAKIYHGLKIRASRGQFNRRGSFGREFKRQISIRPDIQDMFYGAPKNTYLSQAT